MKSLHLIALLILIHFSYSLSAQKIKGIIINKETKSPIAYVNIGIPNKNSGTVSDTEGAFSLTIDESHQNDSLKFSCIGFESKTLSIKDMLTNKPDKVELNEKIN